MPCGQVLACSNFQGVLAIVYAPDRWLLRAALYNRDRLRAVRRFWETGCVACRSAKVRPTIGQAFCRGIGAIGSEDFVQSMRSKAALKVCTLGATIAPSGLRSLT